MDAFYNNAVIDMDRNNFDYEINYTNKSHYAIYVLRFNDYGYYKCYHLLFYV